MRRTTGGAKLRGHAEALAFLLAAVLAFHARVLFTSTYTIPWDFRDYHLPLAEFAAACLRRVELPLWDPYTYCGFPFYANLQTQLFYPPAWAVFALGSLGADVLTLLEWQIALHVFLGAASTYLLLIRLNAGRSAAALGGVVFALGGYFASQAQHLGAVCAAAWLPAAWMGVFALAGGFRWRRMAALSAALAMALLAGFPAVSMVVFGSTLLLAGALLVTRRFRSAWLLGAAAAACLWAALLSAAMLFPAAELSGLSTAPRRWEWASDGGGGVPWQGLVSLVAPNYYNVFDLERYRLPWNATFLYLYCGLGGLALALAAAIWRPDRPRAAVGLTTLASAMWTLGNTTPIGRHAYNALPAALKSPMYAEFAMAAFQLGMALLAGLAAGRWLGGRREVYGWILAVATAAELILVGAGRPMNIASTADDPGVSARQFNGSAETLETVRELAYQTLPPARLEAWKSSARWVRFAPVIRIPSTSGDDPLALARYLEVRRLFAPSPEWLRYSEPAEFGSPLLDLLNVRYLIAGAAGPEAVLDHPGWRRVAEVPGHQVYENPDFLPRFFLVGGILPARGMREALVLLSAPGLDPRRAAVVEDAPAWNPAPGAIDPAAVRVVSYGPREIVLETASAAPAFLVTSEPHYPGWGATVDGRPERIYQTNVAFRGLPLPAGRHTVTLRFAPGILPRSLAVSAAALLLLGLALTRRG